MSPRDVPPSTSSIARLPSPITYASFRPFLLSNSPCLFPPAHVLHWPLFASWLTADGALNWGYLREAYGAEEVRCVACEAERGEGGPLDKEEEGEGARTFGELLELWEQGRGTRLYLKDWHLPLAIHRAGAALLSPSSSSPSPSGDDAAAGRARVSNELYPVDPCWADDWMNEWEGGPDGRGDDFRFVYAGGGGTGTRLHRDVYCSYSISTNLHGRKRWFLFPPALAPALRELVRAAERRGEDGVDCESWSEDEKEAWRGRGMRVVEQEQGETIFIPSGWFHSVTNLTHPTLSLNHNWANAHCLPSVYSSLCEEVGRAREAIEDVRELLIERARRDGREGEGEEAWKGEWEKEVDGLVERSEGWSFPIFLRMVLFTLALVALADSDPAGHARRTRASRWPAVPDEARPPVEFVIAQVEPIIRSFRQRKEQEWRWLPGVQETLHGIERELERLRAVAAAIRET